MSSSAILSTPISVTSTNLRPFTNKDITNDVAYKHGLARPMKHYRLGFINTVSLDPSKPKSYLKTNVDRYVRSSRSTPLLSLMNRPGHVTESVSNVNFASDVKSDLSDERDNNCCEPTKALKLARGASTNLSQTYYQTNQQYRHARCKTIKQNEYNYTTDGGKTYTSNCSTNNCNEVVYKPSNAKFAQQGGVSSSSRTSDLVLNTIKLAVKNTKNKATADNFSNPNGVTTIPFILKAKSVVANQTDPCCHRKGT